MFLSDISELKYIVYPSGTLFIKKISKHIVTYGLILTQEISDRNLFCNIKINVFPHVVLAGLYDVQSF
jgi:hypothetical protein